MLQIFQLTSESIPLEQGLRQKPATGRLPPIQVRGYSITTRIKTLLQKFSLLLLHSHRIFHQNKDLERKLGDSNLKYGKSIAIPQKQEPQTKI